MNPRRLTPRSTGPAGKRLLSRWSVGGGGPVNASVGQLYEGERTVQLHVEWNRTIPLRDASRKNLIYEVDLSRVPENAGVYIFGRSWGSGFEALYVGKGTRLRGRVQGQFNNLRLMQHLRNAKNGRRILLCGRAVTKPGQRVEKVLTLSERALIRYFLSEGHDLVNKQGTRLRRHELMSSGKHPKRYFPSAIFLERSKGE